MHEDFPLGHFFRKSSENKESSEQTIIDKSLESQDQSHFLSLLEKSHEPVSDHNSSDTQEIFSSDEIQSLTDELLSLLQRKLSAPKYQAFFRTTFSIRKIGEGSISCYVTTSFIKKMVETHYLSILQNCFEQLLGAKYRIDIDILNSDQGLSSNEANILKVAELGAQQSSDYRIHRGKSVKDMSFEFPQHHPETDDRRYRVSSEVLQHMQKGSHGQQLDRNKNFSNFIVGPSNNMAHASCLAAARSPGKVYPCLYLHGHSGLGKTHLVHAVGNYIQEEQPHLRIVITTANEFMAEMVDSIQNQRIQQFRKKYSELVDVLMIDDIHELKNRPGTQNEFFHVFNELHNKGKQLIFTSDKHPKEINGIEDRIRTRLSWGLILDIQRPDFETRVAILKRKAQDEDIFVPDDVLALIASTVKTSIRELEGSLIKLVAYASVFKVDIDLEIAKQQLKIMEEHQEKVLDLEDVAESIAQNYQVALGDLRGKTRSRQVTLLRHLAMYFCHKFVKTTLSEIGLYFGGRDHTSVMHAIEKINRQARNNPAVEQLKSEIQHLLK